jgi:hypothetical protein
MDKKLRILEARFPDSDLSDDAEKAPALTTRQRKRPSPRSVGRPAKKLEVFKIARAAFQCPYCVIAPMGRLDSVTRHVKRCHGPRVVDFVQFKKVHNWRNIRQEICPWCKETRACVAEHLSSCRKKKAHDENKTQMAEQRAQAKRRREENHPDLVDFTANESLHSLLVRIHQFMSSTHGFTTARSYAGALRRFFTYVEHVDKTFKLSAMFSFDSPRQIVLPSTHITEFQSQHPGSPALQLDKALKVFLNFLAKYRLENSNTAPVDRLNLIEKNENDMRSALRISKAGQGKVSGKTKRRNDLAKLDHEHLSCRPVVVRNMLRLLVQCPKLDHYFQTLLRDGPALLQSERLQANTLRNICLGMFLATSGGQRGAAFLNLTLDEWQKAKPRVPNGEFILSILDHKTSAFFGPIQIPLCSDVTRLLTQLYVDHARARTMGAKAAADPTLVLFASSRCTDGYGWRLDSCRGAMSWLIPALKDAGVDYPPDQNLTTLTSGAIRKGYASFGARHSDARIRAGMPTFMAHSRKVAERDYIVDENGANAAYIGKAVFADLQQSAQEPVGAEPDLEANDDTSDDDFDFGSDSSSAPPPPRCKPPLAERRKPDPGAQAILPKQRKVEMAPRVMAPLTGDAKEVQGNLYLYLCSNLC